ncbi:amino acid ABC transporter permease [Haloarchaeobius amylolyticus]|uniref:amino acid ABC transporter permease n=1 Tax=Haloarchaeobius amylolyticus TaxID=1198296 RepID=UPI00226FB673|nr:amino acid ABC transporter permease [Haloarchaeobius amylolyticus]
MVFDIVQPDVVLQSSDWAYVLENLDVLVFEGARLTVVLTVFSILLGFAVGLPAGIVEVYGSPWLRRPVEAVGVVLRAVPLLVILIFMYYVFSVSSDPVLAGIIALGLRSGAYQAQIFRGTLQSVSEGQMEAARSVGMSKLQAIRHVVVPQALRRSIPGFQNEFTIVLKDTSIIIILGVTELLGVTEDLFLQENRTGAALELILAASAIYFVLTFVTNRGLDYAGEYFGVPSGENA